MLCMIFLIIYNFSSISKNIIKTRFFNSYVKKFLPQIDFHFKLEKKLSQTFLKIYLSKKNKLPLQKKQE